MSDAHDPEPPVTLTPTRPPAPLPPPAPKPPAGKLPPRLPQPKSVDDVTARLATGQHLQGRPPRKRMTHRAWLGLGMIGLGFGAAFILQIHLTVVLFATGGFVFWNEWTGRGND